jgi:hypothetical protein
MTEPRVEAGDRALETARKICELFADGEDHTTAEVAAEIQSAMNAQEREWQAFLVKARKRVKELETMEFRDFTQCRAGELAVWRVVVEEAERLLAERGAGMSKPRKICDRFRQDARFTNGSLEEQ